MEPPTLAFHNATARMTSATTAPYDSNLPARPAQVAQVAHLGYAPQSSSRHSVDVGYPVLDEKHVHPQRQSHYAYGAPSPPAIVQGTSVSSAGGNSAMTGATVDTIDLEKGSIESPSRQSESRRSSRIPRGGRQEMSERQSRTYYPSSRHGSGNSLPYDRRLSPPASVQSNIDDELELVEHRQMLESKALNILLFLSGPCAILSFVLFFYSLVATLGIFLIAPLRLCTTQRNSLWEQILETLSSSQRLQLRCIYAPATSQVEGRSVASLALNILVAPVLSMGLAVAGWTVAIYWFFAAIVGDPDGSEGGDDGKATVLGLRGWWEGWLSRAMRD